MSKLTITEALAEIKTIDARVVKKVEFIRANLFRQEALKDPFAQEQGGSQGVIARERQSMRDLLTRKLELRRAIQITNEANSVEIAGVSRTIADWLVWRRDVAPLQKTFLEGLWNSIQQGRREVERKGAQVVSADQSAKPTDFIVNVDEFALVKEREELETILGALDGQLSLKNATLVFEIKD